MSTTERNPLILSGEYERVYVCELEPGNVIATGETVERVERAGVGTWVDYTDRRQSYYGRSDSTVLVSTRRVP